MVLQLLTWDVWYVLYHSKTFGYDVFLCKIWLKGLAYVIGQCYGAIYMFYSY